jgi:hypothetical protein
MRTTINASTLTRWAAIPLRAIVGYGFIAHGYPRSRMGPRILSAFCTTSVFRHQGLWGGRPFSLRLLAVWLCPIVLPTQTHLSA